MNVYHVPSAPLNYYVEAIWHSAGVAPAVREKILPSVSIGMTFNFGDPSRVSTPNRARQFTDCTESWISGLRSGYCFLEVSPTIQMMSVDFKPGGAFPFLHFPLSEAHNQTISLDAIWGSFAGVVREHLYEATTVQARFSLLERLLLARLSDAQNGLDAVRHAVEAIARCHGSLSIGELSARMGLSQKQLITQFKRAVGLTPKAMARVYRFRYVLQNLDPLAAVDWAEIAHQAHYYDQSHCHKDFKAFTGHSPGEYLRLRREAHIENPEHAQYLNHLPAG
ncbi:MAG: helix-turn-helix domain-containing protein [Anaerolineae bacterium]|nr:helix-turn-helix domain-containing protein [Anaerolineae bacterium]